MNAANAAFVVLAWMLVTVDAQGRVPLHRLPEHASRPRGSVSASTIEIDGHPRVFRSGVDLVALNVVVTDSHEHLVTELTADDFVVFEDNVRQEISFLATTDVPLDLAILLDTSASMTDSMETVRTAAIGFASSIRPGDRITIVEIKDDVQVRHPLDENLAGAVDAIRLTAASGQTVLYNGLYVSMKEMIRLRRRDEVRRQAIVVLSDGNDTASLLSFDDVMELAKSDGIAIYTITPRSAIAMGQAAEKRQRYFSQMEAAMKALAHETGARAFFPTANLAPSLQTFTAPSLRSCRVNMLWDTRRRTPGATVRSAT
jgi:Ca-activated chloride channel family protein